MPLPLRCLSAYTALCAAALAVLGLGEFVHDPSAWSATRGSWALPLVAVGLYGAAQLVTVPERWAWASLVSLTVFAMTASMVFHVTGFAIGVTALAVLSLPSSRVFAHVTPPTASRL
jgi:hypothetical protein